MSGRWQFILSLAHRLAGFGVRIVSIRSAEKWQKGLKSKAWRLPWPTAASWDNLRSGGG